MSDESNALFLWDNAATRGTVSASSTATGLPATNLQDPQRSKKWRSGAVTTANIDVTLSVDETTPVGAVAIVDHNITALGTIRLRGWSDAIGGSELVVDTTIEPWDGLYGYGVGGYGAGGYGGLAEGGVQTLVRPVTFIPLTAFYADLYWRITLADSTLSYIEAGVVYVGGVWQPKTNMSWGNALGREPRTKKRRSRGGQDYGNTRAGRAFFNLQFDWLEESDRDELWLQYLRIEDHTPFIFAARPTGGVELLTHTLYGKFEPFEMTASHTNNSRTKIKIVEDL